MDDRVKAGDERRNDDQHHYRNHHAKPVKPPKRVSPSWREYGYKLTPGKPFVRYGIEQQAEIVRHWFLSVQGTAPAGDGSHSEYASLLPFGVGVT
jgi:hypothetical protein